MMDMFSFNPGEREERLLQVQRQLTSQPNDTLNHFEMASYVELRLLQQLRQFVLPYVDSLGMNEQELANLQQVLSHGRTTLATDWNPRIAHTLDLMRQVFISLLEDHKETSAGDPDRRRISRIHVHTLAYQAILTTAGSKWKNTRAAAAKAALTAHRYVCKSQFVSLVIILRKTGGCVPFRFNPSSYSHCRLIRKLCSRFWTTALLLRPKQMLHACGLVPLVRCRAGASTSNSENNDNAWRLRSVWHRCWCAVRPEKQPELVTTYPPRDWRHSCRNRNGEPKDCLV